MMKACLTKAKKNVGTLKLEKTPHPKANAFRSVSEDPVKRIQKTPFFVNPEDGLNICVYQYYKK
jgi:hypothetical protein